MHLLPDPMVSDGQGRVKALAWPRGGIILQVLCVDRKQGQSHEFKTPAKQATLHGQPIWTPGSGLQEKHLGTPACSGYGQEGILQPKS